jgi:tetratricopeptide (TPR) repeat protein
LTHSIFFFKLDKDNGEGTRDKGQRAFFKMSNKVLIEHKVVLNAQQLLDEGWIFEQLREYKKAIGMYYAAARLGNSEACRWMALAYTHGEGKPINQTKAIKWYQKATKLGCKKSAEALANRYFYGDCKTKIDYPQAFQYCNFVPTLETPECFYKYIVSVWLGLTDPNWKTKPNSQKAAKIVQAFHTINLALQPFIIQSVFAQVTCFFVFFFIFAVYLFSVVLFKLLYFCFLLGIILILFC